jgi:hypothetical protein
MNPKVVWAVYRRGSHQYLSLDIDTCLLVTGWDRPTGSQRLHKVSNPHNDTGGLPSKPMYTIGRITVHLPWLKKNWTRAQNDMNFIRHGDTEEHVPSLLKCYQDAFCSSIAWLGRFRRRVQSIRIAPFGLSSFYSTVLYGKLPKG